MNLRANPEGGRPRALVTAPMAANAFEGFLWGDPGINLADVRADFRAVAEWDYAHRKLGVWMGSPRDVAACIVMGIDPETGQGITNKEAAVAVYENFGPPSMRVLKGDYERLMANPRIQRELARERVE